MVSCVAFQIGLAYRKLQRIPQEFDLVIRNKYVLEIIFSASECQSAQAWGKGLWCNILWHKIIVSSDAPGKISVSNFTVVVRGSFFLPNTLERTLGCVCFFLLLLLFLFSFILCFIWSHLFFGLHTAQQSVRTLKQPVTLYLPYHCGYKVLCWVIYIHRAEDKRCFQKKGTWGKRSFTAGGGNSGEGGLRA